MSSDAMQTVIQEAHAGVVRRKDIGLVTRLVRVVDDFETGRLMREARIRRSLSLRKMAALLGQSPPFISDLELGRRKWTEQRIEQWAEILCK
jgi:predicted transcriptional regulator